MLDVPKIPLKATFMLGLVGGLFYLFLRPVVVNHTGLQV